ncbi:MAG: alanine racemase [Anaerolineaceae bacterium]|nr:alanine racemase [Anaerolineaceae bacterium]
MPIYETISKPTLLIDKRICQQNINWMANKAKSQNVIFRPHFKTHQSAKVAEWFRQAGVTQITVSSLGMAAYFAKHNWSDITVAFPVNLREIQLINQLAEKINLGLLVEDISVIQTLDKLLTTSIQVWLKIDVGYHRTGLNWEDQPTIATCAFAVQQSKNLKFMGLLTHGGNNYHTPKNQIPMLFKESISRMNVVKESLMQNGMDQILISVGDTPGCSLSDSFAGADEIRPGNFVYFDGQQYVMGICTFEQIAVSVACPIVALHPERNEVVIYGGGIHLSKDSIQQGQLKHFGFVTRPDQNKWGSLMPGAYVKSLSQEHGVLHLPDSAITSAKIGDILCIIPAHSCMTANLLGRGITTDREQISMYRYGDC